MRHDKTKTPSKQLPVPSQEQTREVVEHWSRALTLSGQRRGRKPTLSAMHLCLAIVLCGLEGFGSQLRLWRLICLEPIGDFAPVQVVDQAIYNRLATVAPAMKQLFEQISASVCQQTADWEDRRVAPWASRVLALDESTLDVVGRWLPQLRALCSGDTGLLAGRLCGLFDVRRQQWVRLELLEEAGANCKQFARQMLLGLQAGTLLLFDRGYLSFEWFDELTGHGLWWISRYANRVSMQIVHVCYQGDGVLDAIVHLGRYRSDGAAHPVRLVQFYCNGTLHRYLTNVLDPHQLPLADIARLYARRWDIELAFGLLKEHLHVGHIWSAKWSVICVQIWCGVLLAQLFHGLQLQLAVQAGVDPFEVSIDLLVQLVPRLLRRGIAPLPYLLRFGREVGLIRPSTRKVMQTPFVDPTWLSPPPPEVLQPRQNVRHSHRKCGRRPCSTPSKGA